MTDDRTKIERIVMQRVYLIRALRVAASGSVLSALVSLLALWGIGREVWIARVLQNQPHDLGELVRFYTAAFLHTHLIVQILVVLLVGSFVFLAREIGTAVAVMRENELV
ncbi:MAG TPA: hypothetical protein VFP46_01050 [Candidatus Paceibacterota bacterium]|nr:hypothetical protein [Candidatus Paceibacterota bacterium]